jgi:tRNA threonylcarbamoyladenosine biosynthesis protein TsaB
VNVLALDTSTARAAVALGVADGSRLVATVDPSLRHGRELLPAIRSLLRRADLRASDLQTIAVGLGPGSYTGLRVGVTAAKTLCYATGSRLIGLDSLEFFARSAPADSLRVVALSDAQRGDFHVAEFARNSAGERLIRLGDTRIVAASEVFSVPGPPCVAVGPGVDRWEGPWPDGVTPIREDVPDPTILLDMLHDAVIAGRRDDPWFLEPVYLRRSAAEDQWVAKKTPS